MKDKLVVGELQEKLRASQGYMVGVTLLEDGILSHYLLTSNFPVGDIKDSMGELVKLSSQVDKGKVSSDDYENKK
jgi:hypothetical protein